ncbi:MAG: DUF4142 domain-containing protein [Bryobacteraceae bacterium]
MKGHHTFGKYLPVLLIALMPHVSSAQGQSQTQGSRQAQSTELMQRMQAEYFLKQAAHSNVMQVQMAEIAQRKATTDAVRQYAKRLETDHVKANQQLVVLARSWNVTLPMVSLQTPSGQNGTESERARVDPAVDPEQKMQRLKSLSGAQFEREFLKAQIGHHIKDIARYEQIAGLPGIAPSVKAYAQQTLPTLRAHLKAAMDLWESQVMPTQRQPGSATR